MAGALRVLLDADVVAVAVEDALGLVEAAEAGSGAAVVTGGDDTGAAAGRVASSLLAANGYSSQSYFLGSGLCTFEHMALRWALMVFSSVMRCSGVEAPGCPAILRWASKMWLADCFTFASLRERVKPGK